MGPLRRKARDLRLNKNWNTLEIMVRYKYEMKRGKKISLSRMLRKKNSPGDPGAQHVEKTKGVSDERTTRQERIGSSTERKLGAPRDCFVAQK